jgi:hypothetical protein
VKNPATGYDHSYWFYHFSDIRTNLKDFWQCSREQKCLPVQSKRIKINESKPRVDFSNLTKMYTLGYAREGLWDQVRVTLSAANNLAFNIMIQNRTFNIFRGFFYDS